MRFKAKIINIESGGVLIAVLNRHDAAALSIEPLERVGISKNSTKIVALVDISEKHGQIKQGEIGLFLDLAKELDILEGEVVRVNFEPKPICLQFIKKKLQKQELAEKEINLIIEDLVANKLSEVEIACFVSACYANGMTLDESAYLTRAIVKNGGQLKFHHYPIVDKHCIGGVPANRTTMVVVPILAAANLYIPKTSTRSITSPAGTSDTMEVLAPVSHSKDAIMKIVEKTHGCLVWGGTLDLASADDKLIRIEKPLDLDPPGILLASIMAKKLSADSTHVLIDIPVGKEAKIKERKVADLLKNKFVALGKKLGIKIKVIVTDGSQPVGNGVGPALEARDVLLALQNRGPSDLREKSLMMAALILEMVGVKNSRKKAEKILNSGLADKKMREIIKEQGGNPNIQPEEIELGQCRHEVKAAKSGRVRSLSNGAISKLAKIAGAPTHKGSGIYLAVKSGDKVKKGDLLFTIYSENKEKLDYAVEMLKDNAVMEIR